MSSHTTPNVSMAKTIEPLYQYITSSQHMKDLQSQPSVHLFLSLGFENQRATVIHTNKLSFDEAWKSVLNQAENAVKCKPDYVKIDMVHETRPIDILNFINLITRTKKNYFRYGISFDQTFKQAFLEQELNGNAIIQFDQQYKRGFIQQVNLNNYIQRHRPGTRPVDFSKVTKLYLFTTKGFFYDGETCYELKNDSLDNGRRDTTLDQQEIRYLVESSQHYLNSLNQENGEFIYGYFSCFDKEINYYNMLRHASTTYSMVEAYQFNPSTDSEMTIMKALKFLADGIYINEQYEAFVVDQEEIKLGANAAAILAFTKYAGVFGDDQYLGLAEQLACGILSMQREDGSFDHVFNYPDLSLKEAFRIVYYDGEAVFALMRLFKLRPNKKWLNAVEKAFSHFLKNDYWKHHDHWLSYCTNELTMVRPEEKYFKFGLKNAHRKLGFIEKRETTYPTFLELTVATYQMVQRMKEQGFSHLLHDFDEDYLETVIHKRAEYQRNGFFYPEVAMYFKNPARIRGSFFIRHHSFRTRIDDVEHYLSGYIAYHDTFTTRKEDVL